jgi:hypothetical protein
LQHAQNALIPLAPQQQQKQKSPRNMNPPPPATPTYMVLFVSKNPKNPCGAGAGAGGGAHAAAPVAEVNPAAHTVHAVDAVAISVAEYVLAPQLVGALAPVEAT